MVFCLGLFIVFLGLESLGVAWNDSIERKTRARLRAQRKNS
jgi:hypothetical protein